MADSAAEARIRDLQRRLELDPSSRLFVALAEELRKTGRHHDALSALQRGLLAHPNYVSAQVALGRVYLESGQVTEAIATFSKALASDPGNLVSAKSLADVYLSRGDSVEAIKKYKLYRALSGDRRVEEIITRLERELAPPPPPARATLTEAIPPPPSFVAEPPPARPAKIEPRPMWNESEAQAPPPRRSASAPVELAHVAFEPGEDTQTHMISAEPHVLSRDIPLWTIPPQPPSPPVTPAPDATPVPTAPAPPLASSPGAEADVKTRALRISEILGPAILAAARSSPSAPPTPTAPLEAAPASKPPQAPPPAPEPARPVPPPPAPTPVPANGGPRGRTLADLYFAQGHYAEALGIYDDLVVANPGDEELKRLRRDAEARLLPAARTPEAVAPDPGLERRLSRIRVLKQWLSVVQAR